MLGWFLVCYMPLACEFQSRGCGTCLEVTCGGNVGHAISVDSNDYDANQFMDVHKNDGSGFWDKVCPTVSPPDICECSWKVVADSNCYDA